MKCNRCTGRMFLDRVFTENKDFELYCILCGNRKFVRKNTELGRWLEIHEQQRQFARSLAN